MARDANGPVLTSEDVAEGRVSARETFALVVLLLVAYLVPLGWRPLSMPDESRYAEMYREAIERDDWIAPRLVGLRYYEKPSSTYLPGILAMDTLGETNFAVRLPSALATLATTLLVYLLALHGSRSRRAALFAAAIHGTSLGVLGIGTFAVLDPLLAFGVVAAIYAGWRAACADARRERIVWWVALGVACGLAGLAKGFVGWVLPATAVAPFFLLRRRWRELLGYGPIALVVAVAVGLPWALAIHAQEPDFWHFFFWNEHVRRFTADDAQHGRPFWFYVPVLLVLTLPFSFAAVGGVRRAFTDARRGEAFARYLLVAFLGPFLLLSITRGKLPTYVLPCCAPLAVLAATALARRTEDSRALRAGAWTLLVLGALAVAGAGYDAVRDTSLVYAAGEFAPRAAFVAIGLVLLVAGGAVVARRAPALPALALAVPATLFFAPFAVPHAVESRSAAQRVLVGLTAHVEPGMELACASVSLAPALAYELHSVDIAIVGGKSELEFGLSYDDAAKRFVTFEELPAWIAARRERGVALFVRTRRPSDLDVLPAPRRTRRRRRTSLLLYRAKLDG
ncbi:MAG: phospholipid carrier-dependent glycosyltransferase [Planctomycetota bacterium]